MARTRARRIEVSEWVTRPDRAVGDQSGDALDDADPPVGKRQQRHATIGSDTPAIEGRADFLAPHAWQIEEKIGIVIHGGRGASAVRNSVGLSNQNIFQINWLRYVRQPVSGPV